MDQKLIDKIYKAWVHQGVVDVDVQAGLAMMHHYNALRRDAFYQHLSFGTSGLRGVIGAGINRMNVYVIARASQGLADFVTTNFKEDARRIAIAYDTRIKSDEFARIAAEVFAANGIPVYLYQESMPSPCLSYAVRVLGCAAGIVITASHNPAEYNGYKIYGSDGCQVTIEATKVIQQCINVLDYFEDVKQMDFNQAVIEGKIQWIPETVIDGYIDSVKNESLLRNTLVDKDIRIVYSPLNGAGMKLVCRILKECGYSHITMVEEQTIQDGQFSTCPNPNPEDAEALALGLQYAQRHDADLLLATDPDCGRMGIALKDEPGEYRLLSANEVGVLLLNYICERRVALGKMPKYPVFCKTIVTTDIAQRIASHYGVQTVNTLPGFKFIGEQIGRLEEADRDEDYIFGFEESCGFLSGAYVRDNDGVNAALMICDMFAWYKTQGIRLCEKLRNLYAEYGYQFNTQISKRFEGAEGIARMKSIMSRLRGGVADFGGKKVIKCLDYSQGLEGLPPSNVIKFLLEDNCSTVVRPSGTEPKLKVYLSICAESETQARVVADIMEKEIKTFLEQDNTKVI